jgi:hypothetical protein
MGMIEELDGSLGFSERVENEGMGLQGVAQL